MDLMHIERISKWSEKLFLLCAVNPGDTDKIQNGLNLDNWLKIWAQELEI